MSLGLTLSHSHLPLSPSPGGGGGGEGGGGVALAHATPKHQTPISKMTILSLATPMCKPTTLQQRNM